jgi:hypothetical protein
LNPRHAPYLNGAVWEKVVNDDFEEELENDVWECDLYKPVALIPPPRAPADIFPTQSTSNKYLAR